MNKISFSMLFIFVLLSCTVVIAGQMKFGVPQSLGSTAQIYADELLKQVEEYGDEMRIIEIQEGRSMDVLHELRNGTITIGLVALDALIVFSRESQQGGLNIPNFLTQPLTFKTSAELARLQQSFIGEAALAQINQSDTIVLGLWNGGISILGSSTQIASADDFKGLKIRPLYTRSDENVLVALGAAPSLMPFSEVRNAMTMGAIEAAEVTTDVAFEWLAEGPGLSTIVQGFRPLSNALVIRKERWLEFTEKQRSILAEAHNNALEATNRYVKQQDQNLIEQALSRDVSLVSFHEQDPQAIRKASRESWNLMGETGQDLYQILDDYRATVEKAEIQQKPSQQDYGGGQSSVLFITNRKDFNDDVLKYRFGLRERGQKVTCGEIHYAVPPIRGKGDKFTGPLKTKKDEEVKGMDDCVRRIASKAAETDGKLLLFIHGYNNTFTDAVRRGIATKIDTELDRTMLIWSWPSDGSAALYPYDEESVRWTESYIGQFIQKLVGHGQVKSVDIFAHSMGSRLGLSTIRALPDASIGNSIGEIVFAAADETQDLFFQTVDSLTINNKKKISSYSTKCDNPLRASELVHNAVRAGTGGSQNILLIRGVESIDTTAVESSCLWILYPPIEATKLRHSYVFDVQEVIDDLGQVLVKRLPADERNLYKRYRAKDIYWDIKPQ